MNHIFKIQHTFNTKSVNVKMIQILLILQMKQMLQMLQTQPM